jgi:tetratricopeptide (TPR) repeat protein
MVSDVRHQGTAVELVDTPFHAQVTDQCGPSALASILKVSGINVAPEVLKSRVYIPGREGSLQIELLAATRGYKRIAYLIDPEVTALLSELRDGRPVLILQNLGTTSMPIWHYAVVVGYLPNEKRFVLRSGDQNRHLVRVSRFIRSWQRADYWGLVALQPGEMTAVPDADKYIRSVAALEAVGDYESAVAGYRAATERWPQEPLAWLGLGNAFYAHDELNSAESAYKRLLAMDSDDAVALNNLSQVQADRGCYKEASATLDTALSAVEPNTAMHKIIEQSLQQIESQKPFTACL